MSDKKLFWIGAGVYGLGKNMIKNGDPIDADKFNKDKLAKLIKDGLIGQIKIPVSSDDKEVIKGLQAKIVKLEAEIIEKSIDKAEKKSSKKDDKKSIDKAEKK